MLKIIGAVIIIGASAVIGVGEVFRMGSRVRILSALITALETMRSEICDRMTPLPALMEQLARESDPPVSGLFSRINANMGELGTRSFYFIWKHAVSQSEELELTDQERKTVIELGHTLGRYDGEEQGAALGYTIRRMEGYLNRAEETRRSQGKVHAALSLCAGVFVVIILL